MAGGRDRNAFPVHVDEAASHEVVRRDGRFDDMGMDGSAQLRPGDGGAGFQDRGEDEGVEREGEGGAHVTKKSERLVVRALVDVRGQDLGERHQARRRGARTLHDEMRVQDSLRSFFPRKSHD